MVVQARMGGRSISYIVINKDIESLNSHVFLLQPIGTHGFATLNTTLYYREHTSLTVAFLCLRAPGGIFAFGGSVLLAFGQYLF